MATVNLLGDMPMCMWMSPMMLMITPGQHPKIMWMEMGNMMMMMNSKIEFVNTVSIRGSMGAMALFVPSNPYYVMRPMMPTKPTSLLRTASTGKKFFCFFLSRFL